jgi:eukaryotic-like serine/threonine-protein kinase
VAQVARALEALHQHGLHRDVKGDNVLVDSKGHAVLLDVGACWMDDGRKLTEGTLPPGTPAYRSPEAVAFREHSRGDQEAHYEAQPADDIYALGITAYRLATDTYPPEPGSKGRRLPPSAQATLTPELDSLIVRMLSPDPQARGTIAELVRDLEAAAVKAGRKADSPIRPSASARRTETARLHGHQGYRVRMLARRASYTAMAVAVGSLLMYLGAKLPQRPGSAEARPPLLAEQWHTPLVETPDGGVAQEVMASVKEAPRIAVPVYLIGLPMPKTPQPGQKKPPCGPGQVAVNGSCWAGPIKGQEAPCQQGMFDHEGECYFMVFDPPRKSSSEQP